ncbi:MAG: GNAT family N-acetyltransferase [Acidobacteria bacterium]|nr:GNAT family N-acetyltransferase [Acidobacteriota bacterium]
MASAETIIRELTVNDLTAVATVHLAAFPKSALTALGKEAVRRYYEWLLVGPHDGAALAAFSENQLAGFCFSGIFRGAMSGFLNRNRFYLMVRVMTHPWLLFNPLFRDRLATGWRVLRRLSKPKPAQVTATPPPAAPRAFGILAIAVNPAVQGKGAGKLLMLAAERIARQRNFELMDLSVSTENKQAIDFYERLHWRKVLKNGVWAGEMIKSLNENN